MEDETVLAAEIEWLDGAVVRAQRRAADARRLALEIERRRGHVVRRDEASVARHTPDIWSSQAANVSRDDLRRVVGFSLWASGESLRETSLALDAAARALDADASSYRRRAGLAADRLQATRSVSSTSLAG